MCEPVTIGLAIAATAATIAQQQQAAKAQNAYEKIAYGQRKDAAYQTFSDLTERTYQERAKAAQDIQRVTLQARQAGATAKLNALEGGASGHSVDALLADFQRGELANVGVVQSNLSAVEHQIQSQKVAAGRIQNPAQAMGPLDSPLGIISSGLQVASAGVSAHDAYAGSLPPKP